jgi:hypothetical protein
VILLHVGGDGSSTYASILSDLLSWIGTPGNEAPFFVRWSVLVGIFFYFKLQQRGRRGVGGEDATKEGDGGEKVGRRRGGRK